MKAIMPVAIVCIFGQINFPATFGLKINNLPVKIFLRVCKLLLERSTFLLGESLDHFARAGFIEDGFGEHRVEPGEHSLPSLLETAVHHLAEDASVSNHSRVSLVPVEESDCPLLD